MTELLRALDKQNRKTPYVEDFMLKNGKSACVGNKRKAINVGLSAVCVFA